MQIDNHFGVYGICFKEDKLLCIKKTVGPYKGRFDLPGGSQQVGESLTETLVREVLEETGFPVLSYELPRVYDVFVREENKDVMVHHIMVFYDFKIDFNQPQKKLPLTLDDGNNDSDSKVWVCLDEINIANSSPLVLKIKQELKGQDVLNKVVYDNWKVL